MRGSSVVLQTRFKSVVLPALARPITRIRKWLYFWRASKALRSVMLTVDVKGQLSMHLQLIWSSKCLPNVVCDIQQLGVISYYSDQLLPDIPRKIMAVDKLRAWRNLDSSYEFLAWILCISKPFFNLFNFRQLCRAPHIFLLSIRSGQSRILSFSMTKTVNLNLLGRRKLLTFSSFV